MLGLKSPIKLTKCHCVCLLCFEKLHMKNIRQALVFINLDKVNFSILLTMSFIILWQDPVCMTSFVKKPQKIGVAAKTKDRHHHTVCCASCVFFFLV